MSNSIENNLINILESLEKSSAKLVAVTKTKPVDQLMQVYNANHKRFGENKVQEMVEKYEVLPKDIEWHLIGHLQTNKVKYIAPFVAMIHGVESMKLLIEINKQALKVSRVIPCLLQIFIANEETKFGLSQAEALAILTDENLKNLKNIKIAGLMGMATFTNDIDQVRKEFKGLATFFNELKSTFNSENINLQELSMGMSGDYQLAVNEGSTMVRVGSSIFGTR